MDIYEKPPLRYRNGIPIFSDEDEYIRNYLAISNDHIASIARDGTNPFISEELWVDSETATRTLLKKYLHDKAKLLDVGVGLGRLISPLENVAKYGMDISYEYLQIAKSKQIEVCFSRIEDMPYKHELFDVIVCTDVLEHVFDLNDCCRKILSALKPQGILIVRVPYREELAMYLDEKYPYRYAHLRTFDEHSIRLLFERIFRCKLLEWERAGYIADTARLHWRLPIPKYDGIVLRLLNVVKHLNNSLHKRLIQKLFRAVEMNVVIKKTE